MRKKSAVLITSLILIILAIALVIGSTLALLTSSSTINISVVSGSVNVEAEIVGFKLYSAKPDENGELLDSASGKKYTHALCPDSGKFANGGTADLLRDGTVALENITPGDRVDFDIKLKNASTIISIKYNTLITLVDQDENRLFDELDIKVAVTKRSAGNSGDEMGVAGEDGVVEKNTFRYDDKTVRSDWEPLNKGEDGEVHVTIAFPIDAENRLQDRSAKLRCTLAAIQNTERVSGVAEVEDEEGNFWDCDTLKMAVELAKDGSTIEIVRGDTRPSGNITINKTLNIASADSEKYSFTDANITITDGAAVTVSHLTFMGDTFFDTSGANSFEIKNSVIKVNPQKLYDESQRKPLDRAAFIASTEVQQAGFNLVMENNKFIPVDGGAGVAAAYVGSGISQAVVSGNTFGAADAAFSDYPVELLNVVGNDAIEIYGNTFYGENGVKLTQKATDRAYTVRMHDNNVVIAEGQSANLAAVVANARGKILVDVCDYGSTVTVGGASRAVTFGDFDMTGNSLYIGIGLTYDVNGLATGGKFLLLSDAIDEETFFANYVSSTAPEGAIEVIPYSARGAVE